MGESPVSSRASTSALFPSRSLSTAAVSPPLIAEKRSVVISDSLYRNGPGLGRSCLCSTGSYRPQRESAPAADSVARNPHVLQLGGAFGSELARSDGLAYRPPRREDRGSRRQHRRGDGREWVRCYLVGPRSARTSTVTAPRDIH